jgi:pheromone shutdown protein TraB
MFDCSDVDFTEEDGTTDPRLEGYLRCHPGDGDRGAVLLIGVAHDHPASMARVARVLETITPEVLALELPPLAVPLFRRYANDDHVPPRLGGEMSTAIQAVDRVRVVGIDGPNAKYLRLLLQHVVTDRFSPREIVDLFGDVARGMAHALACRIGATIGRATPHTPKVYAHIQYDSTLFDSPQIQAKDERSHVTERQSFLRAIELPRTTAVVDEVREASMAAQLTELRLTGDVVAVVGIEHLGELLERLDDEDTSHERQR